MLFGSNGNSYTISTQIYVYTHILHNTEMRRAKEIKICGTAANATGSPALGEGVSIYLKERKKERKKEREMWCIYP